MYLLLLPSAALAVALVSFRIKCSGGDKNPGPILVPGAEPRQQPWKYSSYRGLGSISPKILLIGRPKIALVFFRIKIRGNSTWYPVKTIQFTSYLSVWQHIKIAVYDVTCNTYIDMLLRYILYSMTLHIICYIIYYIIKKKYYIVGVIS